MSSSQNLKMPAPIGIAQNGSTSPSRTNAALDRSQSQWLFAPADMQRTPSIAEGMQFQQEAANRQKGVNFITQVGIMLKLPQLTLSTASVFLHRYYMRFPMQLPNGKGTHHYQIAATALFLATKVEENCRKMKELIVACCRVAQKNPNAAVDEQSKEYWKWRDTILHHEDMLLEALCFDLQLDQPHRILFDYLCYYGVQDRKVLRNTSWAFLNDSHITTLCLLFTPKTIAGSALYVGIRLADVALPDDDRGRPWWQHLDLNIFEIQKACNLMAEVYENPGLRPQGQKDAYLKDEDIMSFERTRRTQSPSVEPSPAHSSTSQGIKRERESSWGHEGKNGHSMDRSVSQQSQLDTAHRSPKRIRTDSARPEQGSEESRPRIPPVPQTSSRIPNSSQEQSDDVQQRIDDIVNASHRGTGSGQPTATNGSGDDSRDESRMSKQHDQNDHSHDHRDRPPRGASTTISNNDRDTGNRYNDVSLQPPSQHDATIEEVDYGSEEGEV